MIENNYTCMDDMDNTYMDDGEFFCAKKSFPPEEYSRPQSPWDYRP